MSSGPSSRGPAGRRRFRVHADLDLCQGHAMCELEAPEVFRYDNETGQVSIEEEHPAAALRNRVRKAVTYCPAMALSMQEDR